jgi:hypothetical protein
MASITLDLVNYQDDDGTFDAQVLHGLTEGLDLTFDSPGNVTPDPGMILIAIPIEFTGTRADLHTLIDRYEEDADLRPDLVANIRD